MFYASDMEGAYRSDDCGEHWHYVAQDFSGSNTLVVTVEPGDSRRVYAGTNVSLEISDDGGTHWRAAPGVTGRPIREIVVNPKNVREVFALVGMRETYNGQPTSGYYFHSRDRGVTWQQIVFDPAEGSPQTHT